MVKSQTCPVPERSAPACEWHPLPKWFRSMAARHAGAVLLETAKFDVENERSILFVDPDRELIARDPEEVSAALAAADMHLAQGSFVAGFVSYECGEVLQGLAPRQQEGWQNPPLIRLGVFSSRTVFHHRTGRVEGEWPAGGAHNVAESQQAGVSLHGEFQITAADYEARVSTIQDYLAAGHSYQVNFTDTFCGAFTGTPLELYERVLLQQPVSYAAFINLGKQQILSFSPELFYRIGGRRIRVRPMKGTWPRGRNRLEDEEAARDLQCDGKNRAEHVTIVDLLRNDLGRVCELGSVQVDALMRVERYRTLHQMTSDISGTLKSDLTPSQIFQAIFPSGSITGAPKRRTMEIIRETETQARGVYTGSIGYFEPQGSACFNVAIRTLAVEDQAFTLGVGGGITVDSTASEEYDECKLKASFLTRREPSFSLFETMRAVRGTVPRLALHLQRIHDSAMYFGWPFDWNVLQHDVIQRLSEHVAEDARVRLMLESNGLWRIEISPLQEVEWSGRVLLWPEPVQSSDIFLQHKTSHRSLYEQALLEAQRRGFDEVLFQNEDGMLTEGAISNLFVSVKGRTLTPEVRCGVLPGVERTHLLKQHPELETGMLSFSDFCAAHQIWLCNALRGSRPVVMVEDVHGKVIWRRATGCT